MTRRELALLHSRTANHQRRVALADGIVREALAQPKAPTWYIALSGGKDSICVLDLVRKHAPDTPANFSQREWDLPETLEYLATIPNLSRISYAGHDGCEWLPTWSSQAAAEAAGVRWLAPGDVRHRGRDESGVFLGLRADENAYRGHHLRRFGPLFYAQRDDRWHCNPIAWWTTLDVWAYIHSRELAYNRAYDVMEAIGVPLEGQRTGPFTRALHAGSMVILKRGWPDFFNRLIAEHPEAAEYA